MNLKIFQAFETPIYTNIYKESARTMDTPEQPQILMKEIVSKIT